MTGRGPGPVGLCLRSLPCVLTLVAFALIVAAAVLRGFPVHGDTPDLVRADLSERSRHWGEPSSAAEAAWQGGARAMLSAGDRGALVDAFAWEELARADLERSEAPAAGAGSGATATSLLSRALSARGEAALPLTTAELPAWPLVAALPGRVPAWAWVLPALGAWLSWGRRMGPDALLGRSPTGPVPAWALSVAVPLAASLVIETTVLIGAFLVACALRGPGDPSFPVAVVCGGAPRLLTASAVAARALAAWSLASLGACATLSCVRVLTGSVPAAAGALAAVLVLSLAAATPFAPAWASGASAALPLGWDVGAVSGALSLVVGDGTEAARAGLGGTLAWTAAVSALGALAAPSRTPRPRKARHARRP